MCRANEIELTRSGPQGVKVIYIVVAYRWEYLTELITVTTMTFISFSKGTTVNLCLLQPVYTPIFIGYMPT